MSFSVAVAAFAQSKDAALETAARADRANKPAMRMDNPRWSHRWKWEAGPDSRVAALITADIACHHRGKRRAIPFQRRGIARADAEHEHVIRLAPIGHQF